MNSNQRRRLPETRIPIKRALQAPRAVFLVFAWIAFASVALIAGCTAEPAAAEQLRTAIATTEDVPAFRVELSMEMTVRGVALLEVHSVVLHEPPDAVHWTARYDSGATEFIAIGDRAWLRRGSGDWVPVDPKTVRAAMLDPYRLLVEAFQDGASLPDVEAVGDGDPVGGEETTLFRILAPDAGERMSNAIEESARARPEVASALQPIAESYRDAAGETEVAVGQSSGLVRTVSYTMDGPNLSTAVEATFDYSASVEITPPPGS